VKKTLEKLCEGAVFGVGIVLSIIPIILINSSIFYLKIQDSIEDSIKGKYSRQLHINEKYASRHFYDKWP